MLKTFTSVLAGLVTVTLVVMAGMAAAAQAFLPGGASAMNDADPFNYPAPYLAANITVSFIAGLAGGWVAARLAPAFPFRHSVYVAVVMGLLSLPQIGKALSDNPNQPLWYCVVVTLAGVAGALTGGQIGGKRMVPTPSA